MRTRSVRWLVAAACALAVGGSGLAADAKKGDVTGTWKWEFMGQGGNTLSFTLKLKQEGDKVTGVLIGPREGAETKIEDGKVKDGEVSFSVTRERDGNKFTSKYKGKVSGDTIKGKVTFNFGGEERERDWEAKRAKE